MPKALTFTDVREKVGDHLRTAMNVSDFVITFAKHEEGYWKVNVEYKEKIGAIKGIVDAIELPASALLRIDAVTGEVLEFQKGMIWRF